MPSENLMFGARRAACAVLTTVAVLAAVPAAAGADTTSTTTPSSTTSTPTTVAPPPTTTSPTTAPSTTPPPTTAPKAGAPTLPPVPGAPAQAPARLPAAAIGAGPPANGSSTVPLPPGAPPLPPVPNGPPPAPFTLPTDFGIQMVQQLQFAQAALKADTPKLAPAQRRAAAAKKHDVVVRGQLAKLNAEERQSERQLADSRARLRQTAAEAYIHAGSGQLVAAVTALMSPKSAVDIGSELHVLGTYGSSATNALKEYLTLKPQVDEKVAQISELADRSARDLKTAKQELAEVQAQIAKDKAAIVAATKGIAAFHAAATSASSPILGPNRLTAKQMADFVVASGGHPRITVPLVELAQDYLDEGVATGVRGDVAFAQSILETGSFADPGAAPTDNNFAGIGWCDTCAHGFNFADARSGVRAQLQLLRIYVDPNFPEANYKDPILLSGSLSLGFRGKVQTWWDLWGTWATGALYGQRVYDIYERMVAFSRRDPTPATPAVRAPAATAVNPGTNAVSRPANTGPGTKKP